MSRSPHAGQPNRPVFVGGCPRSGTTLVRTMLNSHPDLAIPHETRFVVDAYRRRRRWGDLSDPANREALARWVITNDTSRYKRLVRRPGRLVRAMTAAPPTLGSVLNTGFLLYAKRHGKPRWGDKRPSYVLNLHAVFAMFPDAQYVNVVRDPRAVVASICKIGWFQDGVVAGTTLWERSQAAADTWRSRLAADQFLEIQYEHLLADPRGVLEQLTGFLGLAPEGIDSMLAYHEQADIDAPRMHPLVGKPLTAEANRKYEQTLSREEIALIEWALAEPMRRYGYEPIATDTAVPDDMRRRLRRQRWILRRKFARRRLGDLRSRVLARRPVAAVPRTPQSVKVPAKAR